MSFSTSYEDSFLQEVEEHPEAFNPFDLAFSPPSYVETNIGSSSASVQPWDESVANDDGTPLQPPILPNNRFQDSLVTISQLNSLRKLHDSVQAFSYTPVCNTPFLGSLTKLFIDLILTLQSFLFPTSTLMVRHSMQDLFSNLRQCLLSLCQIFTSFCQSCSSQPKTPCLMNVQFSLDILRNHLLSLEWSSVNSLRNICTRLRSVCTALSDINGMPPSLNLQGHITYLCSLVSDWELELELELELFLSFDIVGDLASDCNHFSSICNGFFSIIEAFVPLLMTYTCKLVTHAPTPIDQATSASTTVDGNSLLPPPAKRRRVEPQTTTFQSVTPPFLWPYNSKLNGLHQKKL